jgi:MEMO1 family protein
MNTMHRIRESIVDGLFYPANPDELNTTIDKLMESADTLRFDASAIIAPHASYEFCGPTVAASYRAASKRIVDTVVIIAPVHREQSNEVFLTESNEFATPAGTIDVDIELTHELEACSTKIHQNDIPHLEEHAIEVQLPFIRNVFPNAKIVPILLGKPTHANVRVLAGALGAVFGETLHSVLFVVSSNLCSNCDDKRAEMEVGMLSQLITDRDPKGIIDRYEEKTLTSCGSGCIATILSLFSGELEVMTHTSTRSPVSDISTDDEAATYYGSFSLHFPRSGT